MRSRTSVKPDSARIVSVSSESQPFSCCHHHCATHLSLGEDLAEHQIPISGEALKGNGLQAMPTPTALPRSPQTFCSSSFLLCCHGKKTTQQTCENPRAGTEKVALGAAAAHSHGGPGVIVLMVVGIGAKAPCTLTVSLAPAPSLLHAAASLLSSLFLLGSFLRTLHLLFLLLGCSSHRHPHSSVDPSFTRVAAQRSPHKNNL